MLPGLERLKVGQLIGEEVPPETHETLIKGELRREGVVFGAFGTSGIVDSFWVKAIKSEFALLKAVACDDDKNEGGFNKGVPVKDVQPLTNSWLNPFTYQGIDPIEYTKAVNILHLNGVFYRWTLPQSEPRNQASMEALVDEAYTMIEAMIHGFGPSIYAAYITTVPYPCLHAVMDSGTPLDSYINRMKLDEVDDLVEQLEQKCKLASQAGLLLLDTKPKNVVCTRGTDYRVVVMLIDFDTSFAMKLTINDENCTLFLNLFLLAMHIKCDFDLLLRRDVTLELVKQLIDKIDAIKTEDFSLCDLLEDIRLISRRIPHDGPGKRYHKLQKFMDHKQFEWRDAVEGASRGDGSYRSMALAFVSQVAHYFVGTDKCVVPFEPDMTGDVEPLKTQLWEWLLHGVYEKSY